MPYLLASRDADKLINFHIGRGRVNRALPSNIAKLSLHWNATENDQKEIYYNERVMMMVMMMMIGNHKSFFFIYLYFTST